MEVRSPKARQRIDLLSIAIEAVVSGSAVEAYWETLAAFCDRDGVDAVAQLLAKKSGPGGGSERWWFCNLLLSTELSIKDAQEVSRELLELEAAGCGPKFDIDRHALEVSSAIRYLQKHLERLRTGVATSVEHHAASTVVRATRIARHRAGSADGACANDCAEDSEAPASPSETP